LPAPVQPMTSSRFSAGSARPKSSSVEKSVSLCFCRHALSPMSLIAVAAFHSMLLISFASAIALSLSGWRVGWGAVSSWGAQ